MGEIVFVEILDRRGRLRERVRLDSFPATIGRAYTNDVIIDDRFACPVHLRVSLNEDNDIIVDDLKSVNGLYQLLPLKRVQNIRIGPETQIRIGNTTLRFRRTDHTVAQAEPLRPVSNALPRFLEHPGVAILIFVTSLSLIVGAMYLDMHERSVMSKLPAFILSFILVFAIWAGIWSFVNRIVSHVFRFLSHLTLVAMALAASIIFETVIDYYQFMFSPGAYLDVIAFAGFAFLFSLLLYGHLTILSSVPKIRNVIASTLISFGLVSFIGYTTYVERTEFSNKIYFHGELKPVGVRWLSTVSTSEFFRDLKNLHNKVDAADRQNRQKVKHNNNR